LQRRYPPHPDDRSGIYEVLRSGQSQCYPDIPEAWLEASIADREELALVRRLGLKSAMIVPLVARGRTLGAITLAWAESGRRYRPIDLALAEELARQQLRGQRRTVHGDKRSRAAPAARVQRAREDALAGAVLAAQEDRRVGSRRALEHPVQTLLTLLLFAPLLLASLVMTAVEAALRRGGTIEAYAIKE